MLLYALLCLEAIVSQNTEFTYLLTVLMVIYAARVRAAAASGHYRTYASSACVLLLQTPTGALYVIRIECRSPTL